ncbi:MAG: hypothetical protein V3V99_08220 [candidate division Zixibacteria bacterium]
MKFTKCILIGALIFSFALTSLAVSENIIPYTNEISYFRNFDDNGKNRGTTLQIISINEFNLGTNFIFEFTGDFNWELDFTNDRDYYIELSIVKPVYKSISLNYQRIYGTFYKPPVNQVGVRLSLFGGS